MFKFWAWIAKRALALDMDISPAEMDYNNEKEWNDNTTSWVHILIWIVAC